MSNDISRCLPMLPYPPWCYQILALFNFRRKYAKRTISSVFSPYDLGRSIWEPPMIVRTSPLPYDAQTAAVEATPVKDGEGAGEGARRG